MTPMGGSKATWKDNFTPNAGWCITIPLCCLHHTANELDKCFRSNSRTSLATRLTGTDQPSGFLLWKKPRLKAHAGKSYAGKMAGLSRSGWSNYLTHALKLYVRKTMLAY